MNQLIHIGYGDSAAGCLRESIKLGMPGNMVVVSRDDFTQGPISDSINDGGLSQRSQYWTSLKILSSQLDDVYEHYNSSIKALDEVTENSKVVLWVGDSAHDQIATSWIITYLRNKNINWQYIDLKEVVTPYTSVVVNLALLTPEQVTVEFNKVNSISKELQEWYKGLWSRLSEENTQYRIQKGDAIVSVDENYHDQFIISLITKKDQLLGKLMGAIMRNSKHNLTDTTIESRLVALQYQKKIKIKLNWVNAFMSKVKLK